MRTLQYACGLYNTHADFFSFLCHTRNFLIYKHCPAHLDLSPLSGQQKKNILQFAPIFHQFFIDAHEIQIRWNF